MADEANLDMDEAIAIMQAHVLSVKNAVLKHIDRYVKESAKSLETYMKINRPWKDHTVRARQGLSGTHERTAETEWTITLSHSVSYGVFLELAHEKRFAIIQPTILAKGPEVMNRHQQFHSWERERISI